MKKNIITLSLMLTLAGCATAPPKQPEDICKIFEEKSDWYFDAKDAQDKWGSPKHVLISIRIAGYPVEVLEVKENMIKQVKIQPNKRKK